MVAFRERSAAGLRGAAKKMACGGTGCQTNCWKEEGGGHAAAAFTPPCSSSSDCCSKCKTQTSLIPNVPTYSHEASLCLDCFRSYLFGKFKLALTSHAMISPHDNVLVAFSGGPASRVALQFIHEMQSKAQKNFDASREKSSLPVFGVGVALVDESVIPTVPSLEVGKAIEEIRLIVSRLAPPAKELYIVPIESVYSLDSGERRGRFNELLDTVNDVTGREDLLQALRMLCLQKIALENGYSKLVLGTCTSRVASHVIAATVKGQGYSLPADVQYVDARWEIPILLPLRDCLAQELKMLCELDSLKTQQLFDDDHHSGINGLVSSFVSLLQEENPSRERTIVRTAEKLSPFSFNNLHDTDFCGHLSTLQRHKLQIAKHNGSIEAEVLCPICGCPFSRSYMQLKCSLKSSQKRGETFVETCCSSCQFQIVPKDPSSIDHFYSLLPRAMTERVSTESEAGSSWLREQIKDCLLSDDENEVEVQP